DQGVHEPFDGRQVLTEKVKRFRLADRLAGVSADVSVPHNPAAVGQLRRFGAEAFIVLDQAKAGVRSRFGGHREALSGRQVQPNVPKRGSEPVVLPKQASHAPRRLGSAREAVRPAKSRLTTAFTSVIDINNYGCNT